MSRETYYHGSQYPVRRRGIIPHTERGVFENPEEKQKVVYLSKDPEFSKDYGRVYEVRLSHREEQKLRKQEAAGTGYDEYLYPERVRPEQIRTYRKKCSGTGCENFF